MNVRINASGIKDKAFAEDLIQRVNEIEAKAEALEARVREMVR